MFGFLVASALSTGYNAEPAMPKPLNGTLKFFAIITSNGEKAPSSSIYNLNTTDNWECNDPDSMSPYSEAGPVLHYRIHDIIYDSRSVDFGPSCMNNDLTVNGMSQQFDLGISVRKYLLKQKFISEKMDPKMFYFISSSAMNSFRSAESFVDGLYPPLSDNEVITIETTSENKEFINPYKLSCKEYKQLENEYMESETAKTKFENVWEEISKVANQLKVDKSMNNLRTMCDWLESYKHGCQTLPNFVDNSTISICEKYSAEWDNDLFNLNRELPFSHAMKFIIDKIDASFSEFINVKFLLMSGQVSTIHALLSMLGNEYHERLPYSSYITMEIAQDGNGMDWIRFALNGEPIKIKGFDDNIILYSKFRTTIDPMLSHCLIL